MSDDMPPPRPAPAAPPRLQSLDTLRGIAIAMVVVFHASIVFDLPPWLRGVLGLGGQGVQLFFLISAFTMCLMWDERADEPNRTGAFFIRRFMRIAPLYWLAIAVYLAREHFGGSPPSTAKQVVLNALFLHGFSPDAINSTVPGGWSIAVEMSFYALFPLLALLNRRPMQLLALAFVAYLLVGVVASQALADAFGLPPLFVYYSQLTQGPVFPVGMLVYALAVGGRPRDRWCAAGGAVLWLAVAWVGKVGLGWNTRPFFWLQVFLFALLAYGFVRGRFTLAPLARLGTLSYSMYLSHFMVIYFCSMLLPAAWRDEVLALAGFVALVLAVSAGVGLLSHATFERWSGRAARRLVARWRRASAAGA